MGCGDLFCHGFVPGSVPDELQETGKPETPEYGGEPGQEDTDPGRSCGRLEAPAGTAAVGVVWNSSAGGEEFWDRMVSLKKSD